MGYGDIIVQYVYSSIATVRSIFDLYKLFALAKFPHAFAIMAGCNVLAAACAIHARQEGKSALYWLHSLLLIILAACGGGIGVGLLLGRPGGIIVNGDIFIPLCILSWYTTHYLGFQRIYNFMPVRVLRAIFVALYRTHTVIDVVNIAKASLSPTMYYPTPFMGPIIAGTINGCFGTFLPGDKGLAPISNGTPWNVQVAFLNAFFYHAMVNDTKGFIGMTMRSMLGTYSEMDVRVIVATVQIITGVLQAIFSEEANLFTPIHKLGYLIFQVTGPSGANANKTIHDTVGWDYHARYFLEKVLEFLRIIAVLAVLAGHIYLTQPPAVLTSGQLFKAGDSLGTCQFLSTVQQCTPYILTLEAKDDSYSLSSYQAKGKHYAVSDKDVAIWTLPLKLNSKVTLSAHAEQGVVLGEDGVLRLIARSADNEQDELLWSSSSRCPSDTIEGSRTLYMSLNKDGQAIVSCSDGSLVPLI